MKYTSAGPALFLALGLGLSGCALRAQYGAPPTAAAPMKQAETPRCSDRVDRARIGGLSGSVLGTIAATIFGTPALGLAYQSAGYIMGFASGHPCPDSSLGVEAPAMAQPLPVSQVTEEDI